MVCIWKQLFIVEMSSTICKKVFGENKWTKKSWKRPSNRYFVKSLIATHFLKIPSLNLRSSKLPLATMRLWTLIYWFPMLVNCQFARRSLPLKQKIFGLDLIKPWHFPVWFQVCIFILFSNFNIATRKAFVALAQI